LTTGPASFAIWIYRRGQLFDIDEAGYCYTG